MDSRRRVVFASAVATFLLPAALFMVGPISVLWPNRSAFISSPTAILAPFLGLALAAWVLLALTSIALRRRQAWLEHFVLAEIAAAIVLLTPTLIFVPKIAVLTDGNARDLSIPLGYRVAEAAALLSILTITFAFRRRLIRSLATIASIAIGWPVLSVAATFFWHPHSGGLPTKTGRIASFSEVSSSFNIFHLMFDSLQGELLEKILTSHPEYKTELRGFTHFREHAGHSNWTTQSLVMILTGRNYNLSAAPGENGYDTLRRMLGDGIVQQFQQAGFVTKTLLPGAAFEAVHADEFAHLPQLADELEFVRPRLRVPGLGTIDPDSAALGDLALLRMAPSFLKNAVYHGGEWLLARKLLESVPAEAQPAVAWTPIETDILLSKAFFQKYTRELRPGLAKPCYTFIHLYPPHRPHFLDADGTPVRRILKWGDNFALTKSEQRTNYRAQAEFCVKMLVNFVRRLKELGLYDSSVIIVQSDTGLGIPSQSRIAAGLGAKMENIEGLKEQELLYYANAALLIKPAHAADPFVVSDAATSHEQTYSTLLRLANLVPDAADYRSNRPTFFDTRPDETPTRWFFAGDAVRDQRPPPPFETYSINGTIFDRKNWVDLGMNQVPDAVTQTNDSSAPDHESTEPSPR